MSALRPLNWAWGASTSCQQHGAAGEETAAVARLSSPTPAPVHGGELSAPPRARRTPHPHARSRQSRLGPSCHLRAPRAAAALRQLISRADVLVAVVQLERSAATQQAGYGQLMVSARLQEPGGGQTARAVRRRPASRKRGCHARNACPSDSWLSRQQKSKDGHRSFLARRARMDCP